MSKIIDIEDIEDEFESDAVLDVHMFDDLTEDDFEDLADTLFSESRAYSSFDELDFS